MPAPDLYNELNVYIVYTLNMYKYKLYPLLNRGCSMESIMKVGPKGQVVIPHEFRHALHIYPGSRVLFKLKDNKLEIKKPPVDAVSVFRETAKGIGKLKFEPHEAYEEELEERVN